MCLFLSLVGCAFEETEEAKRASFITNVENCTCRSIEFEIEIYSGIALSTMVRRCNATVHAANPQRYEPGLRHVPGLEALRCPLVIAEWLEIDRLDAAKK